MTQMLYDYRLEMASTEVHGIELCAFELRLILRNPSETRAAFIKYELSQDSD